DILCLGVSMQRQQYLEESIKEIFNLKMYDNKQKEEILKIWNQLIRIDLETEEVKNHIIDLSEIMIAPLGLIGIKKLIKLLYSKIESFDFINLNEKLGLEEKAKNIQKNVRYYDASKKGKVLLKKMLNYLRRSHPRVILQEYLNQDNLINKWKDLQSQGFQSIDDLVKKKQLSNSDLFDL
ncbi:MAG: hypothetical protein Q8K60_09475, partial [Parachlamydiaceae bacterium]|nr:hypothetical protein [Parachlamydiaceae bacterium]